jgi:hypothetical protein
VCGFSRLITQRALITWDGARNFSEAGARSGGLLRELADAVLISSGLGDVRNLKIDAVGRIVHLLCRLI